MDTLIERKKRFTPRRIYGGAGVLFILVFVFYFIFRDTGSSMTIDKSRITIATVTENEKAEEWRNAFMKKERW